MKGLLFLARVAFICNVLFLICLLLRKTPDFLQISELKSTVVILGWVVAPVVNMIGNILLLGWLVWKRTLAIPAWLAIANLLFLVAEIIVNS